MNHSIFTSCVTPTSDSSQIYKIVFRKPLTTLVVLTVDFQSKIILDLNFKHKTTPIYNLKLYIYILILKYFVMYQKTVKSCIYVYIKMYLPKKHPLIKYQSSNSSCLKDVANIMLVCSLHMIRISYFYKDQIK